MNGTFTDTCSDRYDTTCSIKNVKKVHVKIIKTLTISTGLYLVYIGEKKVCKAR